MVSKTLLSAGLAALALLPAACAGPVNYHTDVTSSYDKHDVLYATKDGPLAVETFGRVPAGQPIEGEALQRFAADALNRTGPHWFVGGFVPAGAKDPSSPYRVRLLFNVPQPFTQVRVCAGDLTDQAADWTEETGQVIAAFCLDNVALSSARGSYGPAGTQAAETVARFVGVMALSILPPRNPNRDRNCRRRRNCI